MNLECLLSSATPEELYSIALLAQDPTTMSETIWDTLGPAFMTLEDVLITDYNWVVSVNKTKVRIGPIGHTVDYEDDVLLTKTQALLAKTAHSNNLLVPSKTLCNARVSNTLQEIRDSVNIALSDSVVENCSSPHLKKQYLRVREKLDELLVDGTLRPPSLCSPAEKCLWSNYFTELSKCMAQMRRDGASFSPSGPVGKITTVADLIGSAWDGDAIVPVDGPDFSAPEEFMVALAARKFDLIRGQNEKGQYAVKKNIDPFLCIGHRTEPVPEVPLVAPHTATVEVVRPTEAGDFDVWGALTRDLNADPQLLRQVTAGGASPAAKELWSMMPVSKRKAFNRFIPTDWSGFDAVCSSLAVGLGYPNDRVWAEVCGNRLIAIKGNLVVDPDKRLLRRKN